MSANFYLCLGKRPNIFISPSLRGGGPLHYGRIRERKIMTFSFIGLLKPSLALPFNLGMQ